MRKQRIAQLARLLAGAAILAATATLPVLGEETASQRKSRLGTGAVLLRSIAGPAAIAVPSAPLPLKEVEFLDQYAVTNRFSSGRPTAVQITRSGDAVLFLRSGSRDFEQRLYEFNVATGAERLLATAEKLLAGTPEKLTAEEKARRERMRLSARGITSFDVSQDGRSLLVPLSGKLSLVSRGTGAIRRLEIKGGDCIDPRFSPDGKWVASVREGDLYVTEIAAPNDRRLTTGATSTLTHGLAEFVAQEEMGRMHGYWWSPDSSRLVYQETDTEDVEELWIPDQAHPERLPQKMRYPRAGKNNARVRLGIIPVGGGETTWIAWNCARFPYVAHVGWEQNAPLVVLVQNRLQTEELLLAVDPQTGKTHELLRETDPAWLNIEAGMPRWRRDGKTFLWSTERGGGWKLELHKQDGRLDRVLTELALNYRRLLGIDETTASALVAAGEDPTQIHVYRVSLDQSAPPKRLTDEPGIHSAVISQESGVSVRSSQSLSHDWTQVVFRRDGQAVAALTDASEKPVVEPHVEIAAIGDGPGRNSADPALYCSLVRPDDFQRGKRYPVIVSVYAGPEHQMVVQARSRYLLDAWLAKQGFVVVSIDGRGTPARGRAWERAIKGDLIRLPLADQVRGLQALATKYPELDPSRVGIFGWSFGGYASAMAILRRPDVFQAAVAGAPVTDWRDYDTHYTERYLGLPQSNPRSYENSSALGSAAGLKGPLLLIHGTADDNVFFSHSLKLANAMFRARRDFDFLPLIDQTHMVSNPAEVRALYTRIGEYFLRSLRGER